ncbi:MAG: hypothetical protein IJP54_08990 [Synergistaceae bacterium]|nr:hypothetical protein [Synergistaceae bacterium]
MDYWQVALTETAKKRIAKISQPEKHRILTAIARLHEGLVGDIKRMKGSKDFRLRVGGWRLILSADPLKRMILVKDVDTRGDIYKH